MGSPTAAVDPEGVELILESNADPAGKAYQEALYNQGQPATQFLVSDAPAEHDRLTAQGVKFTVRSHPPPAPSSPSLTMPAAT
ncbi:hypothetical protein ACIBL3_39700 [Kribbella sp. NPDC050124]|uniref:hypothetical protein n=1 Tax=Kribbella sp. NPDC050124 TaxID=3364114 RepID=UPI0037BA597D